MRKKPVVDLWTFYAIDDIKVINDLVAVATSQFRYNPLLSYEQGYEGEGVIKIAGYKCQPQVKDYPDHLSNFYLPLSVQTSKGFLNAFLFDEWSYVHAQENRYVNEEDELEWEILVGRNSSLQTYPQHILSFDEWKSKLHKLNISEQGLNNAIDKFNNILEACNAGFENWRYYSS